MKLKESVVRDEGVAGDGRGPRGYKPEEGWTNAGVQLIKRELYGDLVRISSARALYYVSTVGCLFPVEIR